jgi:hypothetical protein
MQYQLPILIAGVEPVPARLTSLCYSAVCRMGHGDHWRCIFPDLEGGIGRALGWVPRGPVVGQREHATLQVPGGGVGATVSVIAWPATGLHATFIVIRGQRSERAYLHSAFPAASAGRKHKIRIDSVHQVSCGLEARISGMLGDAALTFFDPLYCLNHDRYRTGALNWPGSPTP